MQRVPRIRSKGVPMKVFISWSGDVANEIGNALREWLPSVVQAVRPYFSPEDISKGSRWANDISKELESSSVGLIIVTKSSLASSWVMFEAGALSKNIDAARVIPILFGLEKADVTGPLVQFQSCTFSRDEMFRVVSTINDALGDSALTAPVLKSVFDVFWPKLEAAVAEALKTKKVEAKSVRSDREILEEVLGLLRSERLSASRNASTISPMAVADLQNALRSLKELAASGVITVDQIRKIAEDFDGPVDHIVRRNGRRVGLRLPNFDDPLGEPKET